MKYRELLNQLLTLSDEQLDLETLEKEYQLQGKLREIIDSFYSKIDAERFTQMQLKSLKSSLL